jgi:hypothetical protein
VYINNAVSYENIIYLFLHQPQFSAALSRYLYFADNPLSENPPDDFIPRTFEGKIHVHHSATATFEGKIHVHHSATATFYAPSELCGAGGLLQQRIRSTPSFHGNPCRDTVFVELDANKQGFLGMVIGRVFFSFPLNIVESDTHALL